MTLVKTIIVLAFFATLITMAIWANWKIQEYWGDEEEK